MIGRGGEPPPSAMRVLTVTPNPALDLTVQAPDWQPGTVNPVRQAQTDAGGKGVNVALTLADWAAQSGAPLTVTASGLLGQGNAGAFEELFARRGIEDGFVRVPGDTRLALKIVDDRWGNTDFNLPGLRASPAELERLRARLREQALASAAVVLAGSLPPGVPDDFYAEVVRELHVPGGPLIAADTSGAPLRALLNAGCLPHILKPNLSELEAALGHALPGTGARLAAARELLARGARWVALSLGAEGAWLVHSEGAVHARPPQVPVQSTVGAGDAMVAGLVSAHLEGLAPPEALRRATAFAAGNVTRLGAGLPAPGDLQALLAGVRLRCGAPQERE